MREKLFVGFLTIFITSLTLVSPVPGEIVNGVVRTADNEVCAYCQVYIGGNQAQTDVNGNFIMVHDPGVYPVHVRDHQVVDVDSHPSDTVGIMPGARTSVKIRVR